MGGELDVLCLDGDVYSMLVISASYALSSLGSQETGLPCLKAANSCLSCDYPENEFASWSRMPGAPKLVEAVFQQIEEAALPQQRPIKRRCVGRVEACEKENTIKLQWNKGFNVSFQVPFLSCSDCTLIPLHASCT